MEKTFKDLAYCAEQSWVREADRKREGHVAGGICIIYLSKIIFKNLFASVKGDCNFFSLPQMQKVLFSP